jgi:ribosome-associated translation inhibitor RaiA/cold shock CspA family protein
MQRPLKITARDYILSEAFDREIREKANALDSYFNRITGCDVTVEGPVEHHRKGGPFEVHIRLTVPGQELLANRQTEEGLAAAIREAFDAIRRQLEDYVREHRGDVKAYEEAPHARVSKLFPEQDYGFLETSDGSEIYFHRHSMLHNSFDRIEVGAHVRFVEEAGDQGPQASTVVLTDKKH